MRPLMHKPTTFMVARTSLMSDLVLATIKFGMESLEVGPEFAANFKVKLVDNLLKEIYYLTVKNA